MNDRIRADLVVLALLAAFGAVLPARAEWTPNGVEIAIGNANLQPTAVSDGAEGAILVWQGGGGTSDILAQRVTHSGQIAPGWPAGGPLKICEAAYHQEYPAAVSDGAGGVIVAWQDSRSGTNYDIYASRIAAGGSLPPGSSWTSGGRVVSAAAGNQFGAALCPDGAGGAIIVWYDGRLGSSNYDIWAHRVAADGSFVSGWPVRVCGATGQQINPSVVPDGAGGCLIVWQDLRSQAGDDVYAQHLLANGTRAQNWPAEGRVICNAQNSQANPRVVEDGAGGAIFVWQDLRGGADHDIYALRVLGDASLPSGWQEGGNALCVATDSQNFPAVCADESQGAYVAWQDYRSGADNDIYATHVLADGRVDPGFPEDGLAICTERFGQQYPRIARAAGHGALVTWYDNRTGIANDIYAQQFTPLGGTTWPSNGVALCTAPESQLFPAVAAAGEAGAVVVWQDQRNGNNTNSIYAQQVPFLEATSVDHPPNPGPAINRLWPNPFSSSLSVLFTLGQDGDARVDVFDIAGRRVRSLARGPHAAGRHLVRWDGRSDAGAPQPGGVYFVVARAGGYRAVSRVVRVR